MKPILVIKFEEGFAIVRLKVDDEALNLVDQTSHEFLHREKRQRLLEGDVAGVVNVEMVVVVDVLVEVVVVLGDQIIETQCGILVGDVQATPW